MTIDHRCIDTLTNAENIPGATDECIQGFYESEYETFSEVGRAMAKENKEAKRLYEAEEKQSNIISFAIKREANKNKFKHCRNQHDNFNAVQRKLIYR